MSFIADQEGLAVPYSAVAIPRYARKYIAMWCWLDEVWGRELVLFRLHAYKITYCPHQCTSQRKAAAHICRVWKRRFGHSTCFWLPFGATADHSLYISGPIKSLTTYYIHAANSCHHDCVPTGNINTGLVWTCLIPIVSFQTWALPTYHYLAYIDCPPVYTAAICLLGNQWSRKFKEGVAEYN